MLMLSIIVPVYNKELFIEDCIRSILGQSYTNFELILVNDGSTDESGEKCKAFALLDSRISVHEQLNMGVSAARNVGLELAGGKYIGFVDGDDTVDAEMYATLIANALASGADISGCALNIVHHGKWKPKALAAPVQVLNHTQGLCLSLAGGMDHNANNKIYRATIAKRIRFEGAIYEDILFVTKAYLKASRSVEQRLSMYNYIIRANSVSMRSFNPNYLQTVTVAAEMVELVGKKDQECLAQVMAFEVIANLSLLNLLLLLPERNFYKTAYDNVLIKLKSYHPFITESKLIRTKHRFAWLLFLLSPVCYRYAMWAYCVLTNADVIERTR